MNIYAIIILVTLILDYLLNLVADFLNLASLKEDLPQEFTGVYDAQAYRKSQNYTRIKTRFGLLANTLSLIIILVFWFWGGFDKLDHIVRGFHWGPVVTGLVYIGILMLAQTILALPFSIYSTFVIEERFGFNKTTPRTFVLDLIKGLALTVALGTPILTGLLAFFEYCGPYAWGYGWAAVVSFMLLIQYIAPNWIMPLFNKFTPIEDGELKERIEKFAVDVKFPLKGIYVMDGSRRSTKSNAFFTGIGNNKRIVLYDTLIENNTVSELVSILAHEVGHYKKKHIAKNMAIAILHTGLMFYLLSIFLNHRGLFDAFYMESQSVYAGLIFFGMLYAPIELLLSIFMQILSRSYEFQADRFAVESLKDSESMISGLKKLSRNNLDNLTPDPFYVFLHYSHPPMIERIEAMRSVNVT